MARCWRDRTACAVTLLLAARAYGIRPGLQPSRLVRILEPRVLPWAGIGRAFSPWLAQAVLFMMDGDASENAVSMPTHDVGGAIREHPR